MLHSQLQGAAHEAACRRRRRCQDSQGVVGQSGAGPIASSAGDGGPVVPAGGDVGDGQVAAVAQARPLELLPKDDNIFPN